MNVSLATAPAAAGQPNPAAGQPNEDFVAALPGAVVLLDGAGLSGTDSGCTNGVAWYVHRLGGALIAGLAAGDGRDLGAILAGAIEDTAAAHQDCDLAHPGTPSATVAILRINAGRLDSLILADSVLVLTGPTGRPAVICDDRADRIGQRYRAGLDAAAATGTPPPPPGRRRHRDADP